MKLLLGERELDLETGRFLDGEARLTQFECRLVRYLVGLDGRPASRDVLLTDVWDYPKPVPTRAVDTAIRRLRRKIEHDPSDPRHLLTVQGEGYRLVVPRDPPDTKGLERWEETRREAERFFGRELGLHDPEVGVHDEIVAAAEQTLAALEDSTRERLAPFLVARAGFTAAEAGLDAADLRALVGADLLEVVQGRYRLRPPWWGAGLVHPSAWTRAVGIWLARDPDEVEPDEVQPALDRPEVDDESRARLVLATSRHLVRAGDFVRLARFSGRRFADVSPSTRIDLLLAEANALRGLGDIPSARERAARASHTAAEEAPERLGTTRGREAIMAHTDADFEAAESGYSEAVQLLEPTDPGRAATYLAELGIVKWSMGRAEEGLEDAMRARRMATAAQITAPDTAAESADLRASRAIAAILVGLGRTWEAMPRIEAMAEAARSSGLTGNLTIALLTGSTALLDAGALEDAERWLRRALDTAEGSGEVLQVALVRSGIGYLHFLRGDLESAQEELERCIRTFEDRGIRRRTVVPRCWAAVVAHRLGRTDEAVQGLQTARQALGPTGTGSPGVLGTLALAEQMLGVPDSEIPAAAQQQAYFRVAQRAWLP